MENPSPEVENIVKDVRNIFRLEKEIDDTAIKDIRNLFRLKKENKVIKDKILRDIRSLFEHGEQEESYYKLLTASNFWRNNYIEYESKSDKYKTLSVEECFNKVRLNLKDKNSLKKSDMWKIQLTIAINFISSKDNDEERLMRSKSDNIEILINDEADKVIKELLNRSKNDIKVVWN